MYDENEPTTNSKSNKTFLKKKKKDEDIRVVICGCGKTGKTIVDKLYQEHFTIIVIDTDSERVNELVNKYDILGVTGNGASEETLKTAQVSQADMFIAVTSNDEFNLLCCGIVKQLSNAATIAKITKPAYTESKNLLKKTLGLTMLINPEEEAALEMSRILLLPEAYDVMTFARGQVSLARIHIPENSLIIGRSLSELDSLTASNIIVAAAYRDNKVIIPDGSFTVQANDHITIISKKYAAKRFLSKSKIFKRKVKECLIVGGGKCAYFLAKILINQGISVKIVEKDLKHCEELSDLLPQAVIINGNGTDKGLLLEEGIGSTQAFIPITGIDEVNVMLSLHAKDNSNAKIITKQDRIGFKDAVGSLNLDSVVYPQEIATESVIRYARALKAAGNSKIEAVYHMYDDKVEALEFLIDHDSPITDVPLKDLKLKDSVNVAFINRHNKIIIPKGNDCIQQGDTVMIVSTALGLDDISQILVDD